MNSGIEFSMDGPMIDGTWYNPQTGDSFTVRDSYFQDGQLLVQATDGRMFDYNILQAYVKSDKPVPKQSATKKQPAKPLPKEIENELEGEDFGMLPEDEAMINGQAKVDDGIVHAPAPSPALAFSRTAAKSDDEKMVERVLQRASAPRFTYNIKWDKFPARQMEMLVDFMGIDPELVINYYISKIDVNEIKEELGNLILKHIHGQLDASANDTEEKPKARRNSK